MIYKNCCFRMKEIMSLRQPGREEAKMKLFDDIEAVWFPEENLIFITHDGFLYVI